MTDVDVYFWRLFSLGAGFALVALSWRWLRLMLRALRLWFTIPHVARPTYEYFINMFAEINAARVADERYPAWYIAYVAWREVGYCDGARV